MAEINLSKYGIVGTTEIIHNPSFEVLFEEETSPVWKALRRARLLSWVPSML